MTGALFRDVMGDKDRRSLSFFQMLNERGIRYAVWKDTAEVVDFFDGDAEVDILIPPEELAQFSEVARLCGYAQYRNRIDIFQGKIRHFLSFEAGKHWHLHLHLSLLTGDHVVKEFCFDALFGQELFEGPYLHGVRIVPPADELLLAFLRVLVKSSEPGGIKKHELRRIGELASESNLQSAMAKLALHITPIEALASNLRALVVQPTETLRKLAVQRALLQSFQRRSDLEMKFVRSTMRMIALSDRVRGLVNKRTVSVAPLVSLVGVDGSGKTSMSDSLLRVLQRKTSVRRIYLGGNRRTYSPLSWATYLSFGVVNVVHGQVPKSENILEAHDFLRALYEYSKWRDRLSLIRRAQRWSRRGIVVVCERYPLRGLFDVPRLSSFHFSGRESRGGSLEKLTRLILARIESELDESGRPQLVILIESPMEKIESRRDLTVEERIDVEAKLKILEEARVAGQLFDVTVINNISSPTACLETICDKVNEALCS